MSTSGNQVRSAPALMAGVYRFRFASAGEAMSFRARYAACPVWRMMTRSSVESDVVVLAIERIAQRHGDFSQGANTLVLHPEFVGAVEVLFLRNDDLLSLFPNIDLPTAYANAPPCGSVCETCPTYRSPCRGCPAVFLYGDQEPAERV